MYYRFVFHIFGRSLMAHLDAARHSLQADLIRCGLHITRSGIVTPPQEDIPPYAEIRIGSTPAFSCGYPDRDYQQRFFDFLKVQATRLRAYGAEDQVLCFEVYYPQQCNFQLFEPPQMQILADADIELRISAYQTENVLPSYIHDH